MADRYTLVTLQAGQPRAYADSIYEYELTCEWQGMTGRGDWQPRDLVEPLVRKIARGMCREWFDNPEWHQAKLDTFVKIGPGHWRIKIIEPYLD